MGIASFTSARDSLMAAADSDRAGGPMTGEEACAEVARAIGRVARCDALALMSTDPETHLPAGGVVAGFDPSACVPFWDNELVDADFNKFNDLARRVEPVATLADATDGDLERSPRFRSLYRPFGGSDELRVSFMAGATCLAIGAFVRTDGGVYSTTEARDVHNLLVPAVAVLRRALYTSGPIRTGGPAVVLLDGDGRLVSMSDGAADLIADLRIDIDGEMPGTIMIAAAQARTARTATRVSTRLRGTSGRWVRVHVAAMDGGDGIVAVTLDEAPPSDLVPLLLSSHGLTTHETDIVLALCRGLGTKQIAIELGISTHTVRDHLKAIFDKTNVNSRGELVARSFTDHVLERFEDVVVTL